MIGAFIRHHAASWLIALAAATMVLPLIGCAAADPELGRVHAANLALQQSLPDDPRLPKAGGNAARGVIAMKRYTTDMVPVPVPSGPSSGSSSGASSGASSGPK